MSGHSKWHNIRLRKGAQDAKRGNLFTKLAKEIIMAARAGGGNPDTNLRLRLAMQKARDNSMPQDNVKRSIQRGTGELDGASYEEITYEGYGPGGVAVLVECATDNRNRTVANIRSIFTKCGGRMGESGSVAYRFKPVALIAVNQSKAEEEALFGVAIDAGADDIRTEDGRFEVLALPENFARVRDAIEAAGIPIESADLTLEAQDSVTLDEKQTEQMLRLLDALDDNEDVQNVHSNADLSEEALAAAG